MMQKNSQFQGFNTAANQPIEARKVAFDMPDCHKMQSLTPSSPPSDTCPHCEFAAFFNINPAMTSTFHLTHSIMAAEKFMPISIFFVSIYVQPLIEPPITV